MGLGDLWNRTLVYFGIAEEYDDAWDDDGYQTEDNLEQSYAERPSANVRRLTPRGQSGDDYDDWTVSESNALPAEASADTTVRKPSRELAPVPPPQQPARQSSRQSSKQSGRSRPRPVEAVPPPPGAQVHLVLPRSFNDAQQIADRFKQGVPVIVNLQNADQELSKRLVDFASGLTYALSGSMQRVADRVFLLTPHNVEVSAEERARVLERGGFFNQA
jgi:cell division inhibitor SepF